MEINKIHCIKALEGLAETDSYSIDLIFTSPPYNCNIDYGLYKDNLKWESYLLWLRQVLSECYRVLKSDGRIGINILVEMEILTDWNDPESKRRVSPLVEIYRIMQDIGYKMKGIPQWNDVHKSKLTAWGSWKSASAPYIYNPVEVIIIGYKETWKKEEKGISTISKEDFMKGTSGVWNIRTESNQMTKCNFPIELPKLVIELLTYQGDLVLDCFAGRGTTAKACIETERNWICFEMNPDFVKIAKHYINNNQRRIYHYRS